CSARAKDNAPEHARASQEVSTVQKILDGHGERLSALPRDGGNTFDFHQRIPGKCGNGYGGSRGAAIREISFEDFVHAIVVVDLGQINGELKRSEEHTSELQSRS